MHRPVPFHALATFSLAALAACSAAPAEAPPPAPAPPPVVAFAPPPAPIGPVKPAYPPTERRRVVDAYRDVQVSDDYRWLEDWSNPTVKAWSEAQNAFARRWLDAAPGREAIRARVEKLMSDTSPSWSHVTSRATGVFALERRPPKQQPYLMVQKSIDDAASNHTLVDPSVLDASGSTSIGWFVPSPDGRRVAVSLARGGAEAGDVHVFDVASGKDGADVVPQADGAGDGDCLAWKGDGSGFFYTHGRPDGAASHAFQHLAFHKIGTPVTEDKAALGGDVRIAQWEVVTGGDGRTIVARMEDGDSGQWEHWVLGRSGKWAQVATKADAVLRVDVGPDGALYFVSAKDAPRRRLLRAPAGAASVARAEVVLPEGDAVLEDVLPVKSRVYLLEDVGGLSRLRSAPIEKKGKLGAATPVAAPPMSAIKELLPLAGEDVAFSSVSYTAPLAFYRLRAKDGAVTRTALAATSAADFSGVEVTRAEATSKDGTRVPLTVVRLRSTPLGDAPTWLTGYGGFGISIVPRFRAQLLGWLEQGGVFAVANIRGGGEMGEAWHTGGNLTHKQNVFDDFFACAEYLVSAKYTTPARLAIQGGSNGGLLMGAELTQHPGAFKAVVAQVGVLDMLRVERDSNGAFNVTEFGSVSDPKQFEALYAYSPYHHVKEGTAYPATLFMTGANDPRVAPYHSRKMTAILQASTSGDAPILLRTSAGTGHGAGSPLHAQIEETTDVYSFLFQTLGVAYAAK